MAKKVPKRIKRSCKKEAPSDKGVPVIYAEGRNYQYRGNA